jgi:hypothetical protein
MSIVEIACGLEDVVVGSVLRNDKESQEIGKSD